MWLKEHEPETYNKIAHVLLPKDYVRFRLTGERVTDVADASGTLLLDVGARAWSPELLDVFGVDAAWLPRVLESPEVSGTTPDGVPVAAGAGDQAAGALGMGVVDARGPASIVLGTSGVVFAARDDYAPDPQGRLHAFCHAIPGAWHVMGVELSAAGALRWLRDATVDEAGAVWPRRRAGYPLATPRPGWAEQDPEDWWRAAEEVSASCRRTTAPTGSG